MHAPVVVENNGQVVCEVQMWNSNAAASFGAELSKIAGWKIDRRLSASHLYRYFKGNVPEFRYEEVQKFTTFSGYLGWLLSGSFGLGPCEFSGLGFNNPHTGQFASSVANVFGDWNIVERIPQMCFPNEILGKLNKRGAEWAGLPVDWAGALICPPEGDQCMGRFGLGARPKHAGLILGSSIVLTLEGPQHVEDTTGTVDFFNSGRGLALDMGLLTPGMRIADEQVGELAASNEFKDSDGQTDFEALFRQLGIEAEAAFDAGVEQFSAYMPVLEPALGISNTFYVTMESASRGAIWNQRLNQWAAQIAIRGAQLWGDTPPEMLILGGIAARDKVLVQRIADMTGIEILRPEACDTMLLGASRQAMAVEECHANQSNDFNGFLDAVSPAPVGEKFQPDPSRKESLQRYRSQLEAAIAKHGVA
jgi:sugar (pentulose or hexulose) kinase